MTNREIIRNRLKAAGSMTGLDLIKVGKEKGHGLLDTLKIMVDMGEVIKTEGGGYALPKPNSFYLKAESLPKKIEFENLVRGYPNYIVAIGFTGCFTCYLNLPLEEAVSRYEAENGEELDNHTTIQVAVFDDEFEAYSIG